MEHVYIHIPFCRSICSYCDFCKIIKSDKYIFSYLDALAHEIAEFYENNIVKTIYIGGGTPSSLDNDELIKLFDILKVIQRSSDCEITFECNPEDITSELLDILKEKGVNRLSIGIESFNIHKLTFMEREADYDDILQKVQLARSKGFYNINVDLIYGVPNESFEDLKNDIKMLLELKPKHISTYALIIEDYTKIKLNGFENIPEEEEFKMYEYICKKLASNGFNHYEVSNFSLDGYESKHNLAYWNNHEYYGFGMGASGYINGFRYDNTHNIDNYINGKYRYNENLLSKQEIMEYELMLGFRKMSGINIKEFEEKYNVILEDTFPIKPLLRNKDLILEKGRLFINSKKIYIMNEILLKMI